MQTFQLLLVRDAMIDRQQKVVTGCIGEPQQLAILSASKPGSDVQYTESTDLTPLRDLKSLSVLDLSGTKVTDHETTQMKEADVLRIFALLEEKADGKKVRDFLLDANKKEADKRDERRTEA